jgi:RecG-like helicase
MSDLKSFLKTTPKYLSILDKNWIRTIKEFLQYFPRTYEDRSQLKTLKEITSWSVFFQDTNNKNIFMTKWVIVEKKFYTRGKYKVFDIIFNDIEWSIWYISIFNSSFAARKIQQWKRYIIIWKPKTEYGKIIFSHPEVIETVEETRMITEDKKEITEDFWNDKRLSSVIWENLLLSSQWNNEYSHWRLFPIYPELLWITSWRFAKKMWSIVSKVDEYFDEHLPKEFLEEFKIMW